MPSKCMLYLKGPLLYGAMAPNQELLMFASIHILVIYALLSPNRFIPWISPKVFLILSKWEYLLARNLSGREATLYRPDGLPNGYSVSILHGSLERHRMGHILAGPGSDTLYPSQTVRQNRSRPNLQPIRAEI